MDEWDDISRKKRRSIRTPGQRLGELMGSPPLAWGG
jgi:hypothetical protein